MQRLVLLTRSFFIYIAIACADIVRRDPEFDSIGIKKQDHTPNEKVSIHHDSD